MRPRDLRQTSMGLALRYLETDRYTTKGWAGKSLLKKFEISGAKWEWKSKSTR
jgi:hypothetical protein